MSDNNELIIDKAINDITEYIDDNSFDLVEYNKVPLAEIATLGAGFASIPASMRTITQTVKVAGEGLYRADLHGLAGSLAMAKDGSGYLGAVVKEGEGLLGQARFLKAEELTATSITKMPVDPTTLMMAIALANIEHKLGEIQETQKSIYEYLEQQNEAKQKGSLVFLSDILQNYKINWNNDGYKGPKSNEVQSIMREAEQLIEFYKKQISSKVKKQNFIHSNQDISKKIKELEHDFKEYQLAINLYSFSAFDEVLLAGNYNKEYLDNISNKIDTYSFEYRQLFTKCSRMIEKYSNTSIENVAMKGFGKATKITGKVVEKIPVISKSQLDENLIKAGNNIVQSSKKGTQTKLIKFSQISNAGTTLFNDKIKMINVLYNEPKQILLDNDYVYVKKNQYYDDQKDRAMEVA